jgi:hypothetical protein
MPSTTDLACELMDAAAECRAAAAECRAATERLSAAEARRHALLLRLERQHLDAAARGERHEALDRLLADARRAESARVPQVGGTPQTCALSDLDDQDPERFDGLS